MTDIAVNASRYGLFVHNWKGDSLMPTVGVEGISFTPGYINSQAVSILRSGSEIVLATSKGGVFSIIIGWTKVLLISGQISGNALLRWMREFVKQFVWFVLRNRCHLWFVLRNTWSLVGAWYWKLMRKIASVSPELVI